LFPVSPPLTTFGFFAIPLPIFTLALLALLLLLPLSTRNTLRLRTTNWRFRFGPHWQLCLTNCVILMPAAGIVSGLDAADAFELGGSLDAFDGFDTPDVFDSINVVMGAFLVYSGGLRRTAYARKEQLFAPEEHTRLIRCGLRSFTTCALSSRKLYSITV